MRVVDSRGLPLTTTAAAAGHYRDGVDAWLRVQEGFGPSSSTVLGMLKAFFDSVPVGS